MPRLRAAGNPASMADGLWSHSGSYLGIGVFYTMELGLTRVRAVLAVIRYELRASEQSEAWQYMRPFP